MLVLFSSTRLGSSSACEYEVCIKSHAVTYSLTTEPRKGRVRLCVSHHNEMQKYLQSDIIRYLKAYFYRHSLSLHHLMSSLRIKRWVITQLQSCWNCNHLADEKQNPRLKLRSYVWPSVCCMGELHKCWSQRKQREIIFGDSLMGTMRPWNGTSVLVCQLANFPPREVRQIHRKLPDGFV